MTIVSLDRTFFFLPFRDWRRGLHGLIKQNPSHLFMGH
jgi:hypothetical protein